MGSIDTNTAAAIVVGAILVLAIVGIVLYRNRQTQRLKARFGPEYRIVERELGSRAKAETELKKREKRVEGLTLVTLTPAEGNRFTNSWTRLQGSFVDDPKGVLIQADQLVRELLKKRGYPVADFDRRAADISVDHPLVVSNYRSAQQILSRDQRGEASTEDLRQAVVHFRALFDELLGVPAAAPVTAARMAA